jgi:hypothetical protein
MSNSSNAVRFVVGFVSFDVASGAFGGSDSKFVDIAVHGTRAKTSNFSNFKREIVCSSQEIKTRDFEGKIVAVRHEGKIEFLVVRFGERFDVLHSIVISEEFFSEYHNESLIENLSSKSKEFSLCALAELRRVGLISEWKCDLSALPKEAIKTVVDIFANIIVNKAKLLPLAVEAYNAYCKEYSLSCVPSESVNLPIGTYKRFRNVTKGFAYEFEHVVRCTDRIAVPWLEGAVFARYENGRFGYIVEASGDIIEVRSASRVFCVLRGKLLSEGVDVSLYDLEQKFDVQFLIVDYPKMSQMDRDKYLKVFEEAEPKSTHCNAGLKSW